MLDIDLDWGADLSVGSDGDLALVGSSNQTKQRILRRLLTNAGDYIWNLGYGAGLPRFVGSTTSPAEIEAVIRNQLSLEPAVPQTSELDVAVDTANAVGGCIVADITFADPTSSSLVNVIAIAG